MSPTCLTVALSSHSFVLVLILRLRQLCCHPYLILVRIPTGELSFDLPILQSRDEAEDDPAMVAADAPEKDFARAVRVMGAQWATEVRKNCLLSLYSYPTNIMITDEAEVRYLPLNLSSTKAC